MNLDFLNEIGKNIKNTIEETKNKIEENNKNNISETEIELAQKLDGIMEYTLDRFEGNIAVCEERKTGKIINIDKEKLPKEIKEGDIFVCINGKYALNKEEQEIVEERIKNKMNDLWN